MRRALLLPLLAASCMVPQELEEVVPAPKRNSPPVILGRMPEMPLGVDAWPVQRSCSLQRLEITAIRDTDEDDTVQIRWFVDGELVRDTELAGGAVVIDGIRNPPGDALDLVPREYPGRRVSVRAVVSDGFDPDAPPESLRVLPGKALDEVSWVLAITEGDCL